MPIHTQSSYGEERNPREEVRVSEVGLWIFIIGFLFMLAVPPVAREFSRDGIRGDAAQIIFGRGTKVVDRLRAFEKRVDEASWVKPLRQGAQWVVTSLFREGNRKVFIGTDRRLYLRTGLRALTGYGALTPEPRSVAKDPALGDWQPPLPIIEDFAGQLRERGARLVLVPVPDKAAVLLNTGESDRIPPHPSAERFYQALTEAGVQTIRLDEWRKQVSPTDASGGFLVQDTHWNPRAMREVARLIAAALSQGPAPSNDAQPIKMEAVGDLVKALELPVGVAAFRPERVELLPSPVAHFSNEESPVVLLGDSFVNIFEDTDLGWSAPACGLAAHLAHQLGQPLHVLAVNGGGATESRERLARLPDDIVRSKKIVLWVLAERDFFLPASAALESKVEWRRVAFNPNKSTEGGMAGSMVVEATLKAKSALQDVLTFDYDDAVYTAEFGIDRVVSGDYSLPDAVVVLWNFKKRKVQPSARYQIGQQFRLRLVPWLSKRELNKINPSDDFLRLDLPLLYAEEAEPLP
ncbi:MAG: alginate O-acetyltransferase AlgX-related protein [Verrucomicrobiales bacterium]